MKLEAASFETPAFQKLGRSWFRGAIGALQTSELRHAFGDETKSVRNLSEAAALRELLKPGSIVGSILHPYLPDARPVRVVGFSKNRSANWPLGWHQDRVIAVKDRIDHAEVTNWSRKAGTWHCEPPIEWLERMVFIQIYLDDVEAASGCTELALGSHARGRVAADDAEQVATSFETETCTANAGDMLLVKALSLHRSQLSQTDQPRRIIRVDFSADRPPAPLEWALDLTG